MGFPSRKGASIAMYERKLKCGDPGNGVLWMESISKKIKLSFKTKARIPDVTTCKRGFNRTGTES